MSLIATDIIKEVVAEIIDKVVEAGIGGEERNEVSQLVGCVCMDSDVICCL